MQQIFKGAMIRRPAAGQLMRQLLTLAGHLCDRVHPTWDDTGHTMLAPAGRGSTTPPRLSYINIQAKWGVAVLRTLSPI